MMVWSCEVGIRRLQLGVDTQYGGSLPCESLLKKEMWHFFLEYLLNEAEDTHHVWAPGSGSVKA